MRCKVVRLHPENNPKEKAMRRTGYNRCTYSGRKKRVQAHAPIKNAGMKRIRNDALVPPRKRYKEKAKGRAQHNTGSQPLLSSFKIFKRLPGSLLNRIGVFDKSYEKEVIRGNLVSQYSEIVNNRKYYLFVHLLPAFCI